MKQYCRYALYSPAQQLKMPKMRGVDRFVARRLAGAGLSLCLAAGAALLAAMVQAQGFKFSNDDDARKAEEAERDRQARVGSLLATPCRDKIKNQKIMVLIGEHRNGSILAKQAAYDGHFDAINQRLRSLGLRTYTQEEIRRQVAQAEIDAYFRNDPDAALAAAKRLGASFILRGLISTQAMRNPIIPVNQVSIGMGFTLTGANGRIISDVGANSASYAGADVSQMALTLINEQADEVVAHLYGDYCRNAGLASAAKAAPK